MFTACITLEVFVCNYYRLSLEKHKATLAVLEPENKELKRQCEHLHKVKSIVWFYHLLIKKCMCSLASDS